MERSLGDAQPTLAAYERVVKASGGKGVEELVRMLEHVNHLTVRQHQVHTGHVERSVEWGGEGPCVLRLYRVLTRPSI